MLVKNSGFKTKLSREMYLSCVKIESLEFSWSIFFYPQGPDSERHSISERTVNTGVLLIAQIHGYLLGLKSINTLIVGLQKI